MKFSLLVLGFVYPILSWGFPTIPPYSVSLVAEVTTDYFSNSTPLVSGEYVMLGQREGLYVMTDLGEIINMPVKTGTTTPIALENGMLVAAASNNVLNFLTSTGKLRGSSTYHPIVGGFEHLVSMGADGFAISVGTGSGAAKIESFSNEGKSLASLRIDGVRAWFGPVALNDGNMVVGAGVTEDQDDLYILDKNLKILKSFRLAHFGVSTPLVLPDDSMVAWAGIDSDKYRSLLLFINKDGTIRAKIPSLYVESGPPALLPNGDIFTCLNGDGYFFDQNGKVKHVFKGNGALGYNPPTVMNDGTVVVSSAPSQNILYFINPDGTLKATYDLGGRYAQSKGAVTKDNVFVIHASASWEDGHGRIYFLKLTKN